jgi:hypothetical protein
MARFQREKSRKREKEKKILALKFGSDIDADMKNELVTVKISRELHRKVAILAASKGKKIGAMVADILRKWLKA